jgi:hypothetical protein
MLGRPRTSQGFISAEVRRGMEHLRHRWRLSSVGVMPLRVGHARNVMSLVRMEVRGGWEEGR